MHTRTKKKQKLLASSRRYTLPQDAQAVKKAAFSCALCDAYKAYRIYHKLADEQAIQILALKRMNEHEQAVVDGVRGTNDPRMFKELFLPTYHRAAAAMVRLLKQEGATACLDGLSGDALPTFLYRYTEDHNDLVEAAYVGYNFDVTALCEEVTPCQGTGH